MKRKCLALAVLAALSLPVFSLASAANIQFDKDVFGPGNEYPDDLVARHFEPIDNAHNEQDYHLTVTGGKAWRIYAAAIGNQDEESGNEFGNPIVDGVKIYTASGNRITVEGIELTFNHSGGVAVVGGGMVAHGFALNNHVTISNTVIHDVYGGLSHHGSANYNEVIVNEGVKAGPYRSTLYGVVWGGLVNDAAAEHAELDHADFNTVTVNGDPDDYLGGVVGAEIRSKATSTIQGTVDGNVVTFNNGHAQFAYGGVITQGEALNNQVFIHDGLIAKSDKTSDGTIIGGRSTNGPASNNHVTITGGTVIGLIQGGSGTVTNDNQITIKGSPDLTKARLVGGNASNARGNTLNLMSQQTVKGLSDFQVLNFHIGTNEKPGDTLLTVDDLDTSVQTATDISSSQVNVYIDANAQRLMPGEKYILLSNADGLVTTDFIGQVISENSLLDYRLGFTVDNTTLAIGIAEARLRPQTQSLLKGNLSRLAFVNQASDLVADAGINAMIDSSEIGRHWFVALQGGSNHYNLDSYLDLDGESVMFGGSWSGNAWGGQLSLGAFIEVGKADYELVDGFPNQASMKGQGETEYQGAGVLMHWDQDPTRNQGWFAEASVRMGRADLDYATTNWNPGFEYDVKGNYVAAHMGTGYRFELNDANRLDVFTKFFYTRQDGEDFTIGPNPVKFDAIDSMRWRVGMNYAHRAVTTEGYCFNWQSSLAYEYEFEATSTGTIEGMSIHESELQGSTGIAQAGVTFKPSVDSNMRLHAAIQAFAGTREGVMGQLRWDYRF